MVCVDAETEDALCLQLRALIEEWGSQHVWLRVPQSWRRFGVTKVGRVFLQFSEVDRIVICVNHPDYQLQVATNCTRL